MRLAEASTRSSGLISFFLSRVTASTAVIFHSSSRDIEILLPQVEIDGIPGIGRLAPQFARREAHGVQVLWVLAFELRIGIGKDVRAVIALDRALPTAHVARQPRVTLRVDLTRLHGLAGHEARPGRRLAMRGTTLQDRRHHLV